jgi:3-methyl-2-oxobutanoate hydroxymethyltransferase
MSSDPVKKIRTSTLLALKQQGAKFACLTSYDALTASIFDEAHIEVILVGDSAADNSLGYDSTLPITLDEMISFTRAVSSQVRRSLVVADLPFGTYELGPEQALASAIRLMKEGGAEAVKLEGGLRSASQIRAITEAGIPVMAHLGFTPQSVNGLGGFKVQGRDEDSVEQLKKDALAVQAAGAFAVVLELVPAGVAAELTGAIEIPTIGIGAGASTDGQILVWTDFAGLSSHGPRKFVKQYLDLRTQLLVAAKQYRLEVLDSSFPNESQSF